LNRESTVIAYGLGFSNREQRKPEREYRREPWFALIVLPVFFIWENCTPPSYPSSSFQQQIHTMLSCLPYTSAIHKSMEREQKEALDSLTMGTTERAKRWTAYRMVGRHAQARLVVYPSQWYRLSFPLPMSVNRGPDRTPVPLPHTGGKSP
jgi:hypothetical protein